MHKFNIKVKFVLSIFIIIVLFLTGCNKYVSEYSESNNINTFLNNKDNNNLTNETDNKKEKIFNVFLDFSINVSSDYTVTLTGNTNLPDETKLLLTLKNDSDYEASGEVTVFDGIFESGVFSNKGSSLDSGNYTVSVQTLSKQPESVESVIGVNGAYLVGENVKSVGSLKIVEKSKSLTVSIPEEEVEMIELKKKILLAAGIDGDNYKPLEKQTSLEENERSTDINKIPIVENDSDNLFENLEIFDVSFKKDSVGWIKIMGKIKNNNSVTVDGYIKVAFYDSNGEIVDTSLIALPIGGIKPGEIGLFSKTATKSNFDSYEFFDSAITER